jgi:hypothetical protein
MKKILFFLMALCLFTTSFASFTLTNPPKKASEIFIPLGEDGSKISLQDLSEVSVKDFEVLAGRKMKIADKISFHLAQRELRKSINEDGTVNDKKLVKATQKMGGETGFHLGGFALGLLLGLRGVLIAYLIKDSYKKNRVKWSWIGLAVYVVVYLVIIAAL